MYRWEVQARVEQVWTGPCRCTQLGARCRQVSSQVLASAERTGVDVRRVPGSRCGVWREPALDARPETSRHPAPSPTPPRYLVLTGAPPFVAAPLSEMYQNIRASRYPEPAHLSPAARCLIARLLAPDPAERPSLEQLLQDDFFTQVGVRPAG